MVDNVNGFIEDVFKIISMGTGEGTTSCTTYFGNVVENCNGEIYCPKCCGVRRMGIELLSTDSRNVNGDILSTVSASDYGECLEKIKSSLVPSLWIYKCTQCNTIFTVVFYQGYKGIEMAILPSCNGGVVTPNKIGRAHV